MRAAVIQRLELCHAIRCLLSVDELCARVFNTSVVWIITEIVRRFAFSLTEIENNKNCDLPAMFAALVVKKKCIFSLARVY